MKETDKRKNVQNVLFEFPVFRRAILLDASYRQLRAVFSPLEHVLVGAEQNWQLEDEFLVHQQGFDRQDGQVFDALTVFAAWLRWPVPTARSGSDPGRTGVAIFLETRMIGATH